MNPAMPTEYILKALRRWPLGTPYPDIVEDVLTALQFEKLLDPVLVVDETGVGRAVVDLFRCRVKCGFYPVVITAGATAQHNGISWHVPKKDLVGVMQVLMGHRLLQVPEKLKEGELLRKELQNFKVKVTSSANEVFGAWREGEHDDLVLAVAIATWVGAKGMRWECPSSAPTAPRIVPDSPPFTFGPRQAERGERGRNPFGRRR